MPFSRAHGVVMLACQQNPKTDCRAAVIGMSQYLDLCRLEKSYSVRRATNPAVRVNSLSRLHPERLSPWSKPRRSNSGGTRVRKGSSLRSSRVAFVFSACWMRRTASEEVSSGVIRAWNGGFLKMIIRPDMNKSEAERV
jgi:hypothetical protein